MMERKFYTDDFEELIRQKTEQYKMYPSDKAWKGIYNALHTKRRRFIAGMSVLISGILIIAGKELLTPEKHLAGEAKRTSTAVASLPKTSSSSETSAPDFPAFKKAISLQPVAVDENKSEPSASAIVPFTEVSIIPKNASPVNTEAAVPADETVMDMRKYDTRHEPVENTTAGVTRNENLTASAENDIPLADAAAIRENKVMQYDKADKDQENWLQENAIQHLSPIRKHKFNLQLYVSPTVNYRKLSGIDYAHIKSTIQNVPIALIHFGDINQFVDHTPAVGYEAGGSITYRLTRNLTVKAGLQFNYSRYIIRAFSSNQQLATIALNPYFGYIPDSLTGYTTVGNLSGKSKENLQNRYYELSAPIGLEMRVIGNGRLQLNVAGSIQPTYLMNRNSYLLTTDYLSYTREPSLFRRWNVNGGLEAFISYQIGGLRWQLGPQFRYQLLSTYTNKYPFRENLMEYGIKLGITKSIP